MALTIDKTGVAAGNKLTNVPLSFIRLDGSRALVFFDAPFFEKNFSLTVTQGTSKRTLQFGDGYVVPYGLFPALRGGNGSRVWQAAVVTLPLSATATISGTFQSVGGNAYLSTNLVNFFNSNLMARKPICAVIDDSTALTFATLALASTRYRLVLLDTDSALIKAEQLVNAQAEIVQAAGASSADTSVQQSTVVVAAAPAPAPAGSPAPAPAPAGSVTLTNNLTAPTPGTALDAAQGPAITQAIAQRVASTEKGAANGVATLDANGKLNANQLPDLALIQFKGAVASQAAMLALVAETGDWCLRTDLTPNQVFQVIGMPASQISNWYGHPVSAGGSIVVVNNLLASTPGTALDAAQGPAITALINARVPNAALGVASGVATLGADGKIPANQLPDIALVQHKGQIASQAAMLALTAEPGDWCIRTDLTPNQVFMLTASPASNVSNWYGYPVGAGSATATPLPLNFGTNLTLANTSNNGRYTATATGLFVDIASGLSLPDGVLIKPHTGGTTIRPLTAAVKINGVSANVVLTKTSAYEYALLIPSTLANEYELLYVGGTQGAQAVSAPTFAASPDTVGRTLVAADVNGKLIRYNSASNATFTIPTDAVLGITDATSNVVIEIYQVGTGRVDIAADTANGVTLNKWTGYPTSTQFVTQTIHRVGANTWAVK